MRNFFLTIAATAALLIGGLAWTDTAEARPWRAWSTAAPGFGYYGGPYYGPPAPRYYSYYPGSYSYYPGYYRSYNAYPRYYYGGYYPYRTYYPGYYYNGVYLGGANFGVRVY